MEAVKLMRELKTNFEQEIYYLPKETGLHLIESTREVDIHCSTVNTLYDQYYYFLNKLLI